MASSRSAVGGLLRTSLLAAPRRHLVARRQLASNAARRSQADGDAEPRAPPPPRLISRPGPPPLKLRKDAAQPATAKTPANVRPEGEVAVGSSSGSSAPGARPQAPLPPLVVHDDAPSQLYDWRTFPSGVAPEDQPTLLLVRDAQLVESVLEYMGSPVGMDIEWPPQYLKGAGMNPTALLQISDGQTILVIQTASINGNCPPRLKAFLEDPKILKLGVGIMPDGKKIDKDLGVRCQGLVELNNLLPPRPGEGISGLAKLTEQFTGCELPKNRKVTMSNWAAPHLSAAQLAYAANDVQSSIHVYAIMRAAALATKFSGPQGWSWDAPHAQVSTGRPRVPQALVDECNASVMLSATTPTSSFPFSGGGGKRRGGGPPKLKITGALGRTSKDGAAEVMKGMTGGGWDQ